MRVMSSTSRAAAAGPRYPASAFPVSLRPVAFTPTLSCRKCPPSRCGFKTPPHDYPPLGTPRGSKAPAHRARNAPVCRRVGEKLLGPVLGQEIPDFHPPLALFEGESHVAVGVASA